MATCLNYSSLVPKCVDCTYDQDQVSCRSCEAGYVVDQDNNQCVKTKDVTTPGITSLIRETKTDVNATESNFQTVSDRLTNCRTSLGPAIGGSIAGGFVLGVLAAAVVFYLRGRILQKQKDRTQSKNTCMYYNVSMAASNEEQSRSERHLDRKDIELALASVQCEATLYEKLSEQSNPNLYDHLELPSENKN